MNKIKVGFLLCRSHSFVSSSELIIPENLQSWDVLSWDGVFVAGGGGGHYQGPLPSSPQLSSSHLDTMWEQGSEATGIAEGRA